MAGSPFRAAAGGDHFRHFRHHAAALLPRPLHGQLGLALRCLQPEIGPRRFPWIYLNRAPTHWFALFPTAHTARRPSSQTCTHNRGVSNSRAMGKITIAAYLNSHLCTMRTQIHLLLHRVSLTSLQVFYFIPLRLQYILTQNVFVSESLIDFIYIW